MGTCRDEFPIEYWDVQLRTLNRGALEPFRNDTPFRFNWIHGSMP
jgi:hypothetical protein